jgi:demethylmenaquinone methyltransferase/2-methoxy-6-polyprenyl-1,4-benzoquinol methylase
VADALHHFQSPSIALKELIRVLALGGRLVIEEPDITRPLIRLLALVEKLALMKSRFFAVETLAEMAAAENLSSRIIRDGRFLAWLILCKKEAGASTPGPGQDPSNSAPSEFG